MSVATRFPGGSRVLSPATVGRDTELEVLDQAMSDARDGRGRTVFIVGEPGAGKSRLAEECTHLAVAKGARVLRGRGSAIGPTVPFRALTEALLSLLRGEELSVGLGRYQQVLGRLIPEWSQPWAPGNDSLIVLAEAVLRLSAALGAGTGCVLVIEDLDLADLETIAVVEYLIDHVEHLPIMLVATVGEDPSAALDVVRSAARRRTATVLELGRLGREATRALVAGCLGCGPQDVPADTVTWLWEKSAGVPLVAEELLRAVVDAGTPLDGAEGWWETGGDPVVPPAVLRTITRRTDLLPREWHPLLVAAAVQGDRFTLPVVGQLTGQDDQTVLGWLDATMATRLVVSDQLAPDWYSFRYPLTAPAVLAALTPAARTDLLRRAAAAVDALHPGLPGQWCQRVASLRLRAGDLTGAATLFAEAGRRALEDGQPATASALLERAVAVRPGDTEVIEPLVYALTEAGDLDRAAGIVDALLGSGDHATLAPESVAALHLRLAWGAAVAGRYRDGLARAEAARALLGPDPSAGHTAWADSLTALFAHEAPGVAGLPNANVLARRALRTAERTGTPTVLCQSLLVAGTVARELGLAESGAHFERVRQVAGEHGLSIWLLRADAWLAGNTWLADGDVSGLERVRADAFQAGAMAVGDQVEAQIVLHLVLCGRFAAATRRIEACWSRLGERTDGAVRTLFLAGAVLAAHQGRRRDMDEALAGFYRLGGRGTREYALSLGLARVCCALLEEDGDRAWRDLARLGEDDASAGGIAGAYGLRLLMDVLRGEAGWRQYDKVDGSPVSRLSWNRQFVTFARAVLLGRSGRAVEATSTVDELLELAPDFVTARHLGLRLVAEAAIEDRWGRPQEWLRVTERYFHQAGVPAVASACRVLLRRTGVSVPQRRTGTEDVPTALRALGVTVREYDVFRLLVDRVGNKSIAGRLHISPRTVEKHVANLVLKTGQRDRDGLHEYAVATLAEES